MSDAKSIIHASDCAVHNEPAFPNGPCDCGPTPEEREKWRRLAISASPGINVREITELARVAIPILLDALASAEAENKRLNTVCDKWYNMAGEYGAKWKAAEASLAAVTRERDASLLAAHKAMDMRDALQKRVEELEAILKGKS